MKHIKIWVKVFTLLLMSTLFGTTLQATTYTSTWGTAPWSWTTGSFNNTITIAPGFTVGIGISTVASGSFVTGYPNIDTAATTAQFGGIPDLGIAFTPAANQGTSPILIVLTFNKPVYNTTFLISDIDNSGSRVDKVTVTSDVGTPSLTNVNTAVGDTIASVTGNSAESSLGSGAQQDNDLGSVEVVIPDGSTVITIIYEEIGIAAGRGIGVLGTLSFSGGGDVVGHLYDDTNGNGTQDVGENDLSGVNVVVTGSNGVAQTVTTDANGDYRATNVSVGNATVDIDESTLVGMVQTEGNDPTTVSVVEDVDNFEENNGYAHITDLVTTKIVDNANPQEGDTVTFTLQITNNGPSTATNVELSDTLPGGVTFTGSSVSQGSYSVPVWDVGTLNNGEVAELNITAIVD